MARKKDTAVIKNALTAKNHFTTGEIVAQFTHAYFSCKAFFVFTYRRKSTNDVPWFLLRRLSSNRKFHKATPTASACFQGGRVLRAGFSFFKPNAQSACINV